MSQTSDRAEREALRLASLRGYDILDTPPEAAFDRLAELAADLFDAPIALVSLVDENRQWFKARIGVNACETPREWSFCAHALDGGDWETLVVEDATLDARFCANPLVTGDPNIRFYAGVALTTPAGLSLGTLCVIDDRRRPRPSDKDLDRLRKLAGIVVDEIVLRRTSRVLASKQQLLEMAEGVAGIGSWRFRIADGQIDWSDEVYRIHGVSPETFDPNLDDGIAFYHPEDQPLVRAMLDRAISEGAGFSFRLRIRRGDGALRVVLSRGECERDASGAVAVIHGVFQDVTDSEMALRRAQRSESRFRSLTDSMADVVTRMRLDGGSTYISPAIEPLLGFKPREMAGRSALDFVHADDRPLVGEVLGRLAAGSLSETLKHRAVHKDGVAIWVETSFRKVADDDLGGGEIVAVIRDVSLRHRLEAALADSEARYRVLAENTSDILVRWGLDGIIRDVSPSCRLLGLEPADAIGQSIFFLIAPDHLAVSQAMVDQLLRDHAAHPGQRREHLIVTRDGRKVWLEGSPRMVFDEAGRPTEVVSAFRDVTERRAAEEALAAAKVAAEAAADAKAQFLANMSHELRTPLTAVVGFARLAAEQPELSDTTRGYVDRLATGAKALMATVNDILDFSKLEAGQVEIRPRPVDPARMLAESVSMFEGMAGDTGVRLRLRGDETLPPLLVLDEDRIRQVMLNLVGNAIKFTRDGEVEVEVAWDAGAGRLSCRVRDTGPGIAPDQLGRLFQRFSQVDGSLTRRHGGTGLGLAICKGLVEAMGGEIGVESRLGEGSCFHFTLPTAPGASVQSIAPPSSGPLGDHLRVLLAEDNAANRELVRVILRPLGVEISEAVNGLEAVRLGLEHPFDLILMDVRMPEMGGCDAALQLRRKAGPNQDTPILAFSADVVSDFDVFDGAITKPIEAAALIRAMAVALAPALPPAEIHGLHA
jgi:PAS domain S-box-containing protein